MTEAAAIWQFGDDRGQVSSASRWPTRVVAYIQAGATLWDHGLLPLGIFGSYHDGPAPDRAKSGRLPLGEVTYFGGGGSLDPDRVLSSGADLVVAVSYGGGQVYGIERPRPSIWKPRCRSWSSTSGRGVRSTRSGDASPPSRPRSAARSPRSP